MTDVSLAHTLDRAILIRAERDLVFSFFTDTARWAAWWGAGSSIDARRGGRVFIRYPGGTEVSGEFYCCANCAQEKTGAHLIDRV